MVKKSILLVLIVLIAYTYLNFLGIFDVIKLKMEDFLFQLRYHLLYEDIKDISRGRIAIVSFDDETFEKIKEKWPWQRDLSAKLINNISSAQPRLIASDIAFLGESDPQYDMFLAESIESAGNVLLSAFISEKGQYIKPFGPLAEASIGFGLTNKPRDKDYFIRRSRGVFLDEQGELIDFSLPIKAIAYYCGIAFDKISYEQDKYRILLNNKEKGINVAILLKDGIYNINYVGKKDNFIKIPVWRVLEEDFPRELLQDKIVLLGTESELMRDIHNTSLGVMPGLVAIANEILMILDENFINDIPVVLSYPFTILIVVLMAVIIFNLGIWSGLMLVLGEILVFGAVGLVLFFRGYLTDLFSLPFLLILVYVAVNFAKYIEVLFENIKLKELAIRDGTTGIYLRRYFDIRMEHEYERLKRYGHTFSLIMIDIDNFKRINDQFGHPVGDKAIKAVARIMNETSRKVDVPARYGGEEFALILPNTSKAGALACAEKIRASIEAVEIPKLKGGFTVSIGVATLSMPSEGADFISIEDFIKQADTALYEAKNSGRNKVVFFSDPKEKS